MAPEAPDRPVRPQPATTPSEPLGPIARRIVYSLVLIPIVPAVSAIGVSLDGRFTGIGVFDEFRQFHLLFSVLWVGAVILIWRRVIVWSLGRKWLTALVNTIPFIQVVYAQPLWNAGCGLDDALRVGQHEIGIGLWTWITVWVWWGLEKTQMGSQSAMTRNSRVRVTPTAKRLVASIATMPFLFGSFLVIGTALDDLAGLNDPLPEVFALTAILAIVAWLLIWKGSVRWTRNEIVRTGATSIALIALPIIVQFVYYHHVDGLAQTCVVVAPLIGWGLWMVTTISIWPMTGKEHKDQRLMPRCLGCGYLLTGLRSTRCPECGDEPTIDALWRGTLGTI